MLRHWLMGRIIVPIVAMAMIPLWAWGRPHEQFQSYLLGGFFGLHLLVAVFLRKTDVLDLISFWPLLVAIGGIADYCEWEGHRPVRSYALAAILGFAVYALLSYLGFRRANLARPVPPKKEVSRITAYSVLFASLCAIIYLAFCTDIKGGAGGLLLVPSFFLLGVVVISLFRLLRSR